MFDYLEGRLVEVGSLRCVLDVGGMGFEVWTPRTGELHGRARVRLWVQMVVTEGEAPKLYGFARPEEREVFRRLLKIPGVGAQTALQILATLQLEELRQAIVTRDPSVLTRVSGIGKKRAVRILTELTEEGVLPRTPPREHLVEALIRLGLTAAEARSLMQEVVREMPDASAISPILASSYPPPAKIARDASRMSRRYSSSFAFLAFPLAPATATGALLIPRFGGWVLGKRIDDYDFIY
ncbi:MAG: Holliday junction branch migration protein RuvA [Candidatus Hydrothermae bacterium]|nr:Holliday junction branch migration protein RuvA [Candidatus Hydrothermae bacterium]